jgi:uncharacterized protein YgbK (DUF1537 family)
MCNQLLVVLDDDPTGTQSVADIPVILDWSDQASLQDVAGLDTVYVLTNSRAEDASQASETVRSAARRFLELAPAAQIVLRGDSTLRGHLLEEYLGVRAALGESRTPPHVVVPAFPSAGRVTIDGVHLIARNGRLERLDETEYAGDPALGYRSSHLLTWGEERSSGFFKSSAGLGLTLDSLRRGGPSAVSESVRRLAHANEPAIFAPDVETLDDLHIIAEGLGALRGQPEEPIVRAAPALAAIMSNHAATGFVAPPLFENNSLLVMCGSHVPTSTRQLRALEHAYPDVSVEADVASLDSDEPEAEIARLAHAADNALARGNIAVVATTRVRDVDCASLASSRRIATNLSRVLHAMTRLPPTIIAKGGITSAVVARVGLGARRAFVTGPVAPGVALWRVEGTLGTRSLVIFPGNVGDDDALASLIARLRAR